MIIITVQGKKRQKTINLSAILGKTPDVNVVRSMTAIDENFIMEIQTYMPHFVIIDFDTPLKVRMDFFDVLSLLKFKNPDVKVVLVASETSVNTFGSEKFYVNVESAKIFGCIVSDNKDLIIEKLKTVSPKSDKEFVRPIPQEIHKDNSDNISYVNTNSNTDLNLKDVTLNSTSSVNGFDAAKITTNTFSDIADRSQTIIGVTSFNDLDVILAYSIEMASLLGKYGSVCICSESFEALKEYHSIKSDTLGISYNGIDIYAKETTKDLTKYKYIIREKSSSEITSLPADFYIIICSAYEWEFPALQEYINTHSNIEINYVFTNLDKNKYLDVNKLLHHSGRRAFRLESSENPFEPCAWNIDTYFCIFNKYIPIFKSNKPMYKKKSSSSILHWISTITVFSILLVSIVYICLFTKEIENGEYQSTEPLAETTENQNYDNMLKYDLNGDGKVDILDAGFLQFVLSKGIGEETETDILDNTKNTEPTEITEPEKTTELTDNTEASSESASQSEENTASVDATMEAVQ